MAGSLLEEAKEDEKSGWEDQSSVGFNSMEFEGAKRPSRLGIEFEETFVSEKAAAAVLKHPSFPSAFLEAKRRRRQSNGIVKVMRSMLFLFTLF